MSSERKSSDGLVNATFKSFVIGWGSDVIVEQLSRLDLSYVALVPGSSYRGLHDSIVNFGGNVRPQLLMALHEEHAISIAHGYAKVTERPMAAALHANVGLMHATMAIYNAFCDRVPMLVLGATGPIDAAKRRPWIDHIHTAQDQGALIRHFVKFDDQPHSVHAAMMSLIRAKLMTETKPSAPVYVCLDVHLQEQKIDPHSSEFPDTQRYIKSPSYGPANNDVERVIRILNNSDRPLFLIGRVNRSRRYRNQLVELSEFYEARVLTDLKQASAFPTNHSLHPCAPGVFLSPEASSLIKSADVIVSFEFVDLAGCFQAAHGYGTEPRSKIVHISLDSSLHNGWSKDHFNLPPVDISISADADTFLEALLDYSRHHALRRSRWADIGSVPKSVAKSGVDAGESIFIDDLASSLYSVIDPNECCIVRVPLSWKGLDLKSTHPLAYLGQDGGAGIGSVPGQAVGAALALKGTPYMPIAILGDGDYLMGSSALWTAAHYELPLLVIVANNASFYNDEVHQERVAEARGRPVENKWIGMRIEDPLPDLGMNARSLGATTVGDLATEKHELESVLRNAVKQVREGKVVLVDVRVRPDGYAGNLQG